MEIENMYKIPSQLMSLTWWQPITQSYLVKLARFCY